MMTGEECEEQWSWLS